MAIATFEEITKSKPEKSLLEPLKKRAGRNNSGKVTVRNHGGGHKRMYRVIDFKRDEDGVRATVIAIEYDPNRSSRIALVQYEDGEKRYILAPVGLKVGDHISSGTGSDIKPGNTLALREIPAGTVIHNIELYPGRGGQMVRSAGAGAQLMSKGISAEDKYALLRLPSGEMRRVLSTCRATIGQVGNLDHENESWGKAGKSPVGRNKGPVSATGVLALGFKTRRNKATDKYITKRRK